MNIELISTTNYYSGEIQENGKKYPFTIVHDELHDIGHSEISEITWTDEIPPNSSKLELKIRDEFKKCFGV